MSTTIVHTNPHIDYDRQLPHPPGETYTTRMRIVSRRVIAGLLAVILIYGVIAVAGWLPAGHSASDHPIPEAVGGPAADPGVPLPHGTAPVHAVDYVPPVFAVIPFALLLLAIAVLPLIPAAAGWWHHNRNRFIVAATLAAITLMYYGLVHAGGVDNHFTGAHGVAPGLPTAVAAFCNAIFAEFIPFIVLLFSLYVISGGINLRGDLPAHPGTNTAFLGIGSVLASFIGTTGAAMVLIRPLLNTNQERRFKAHTVIFFIFVVCNCGGLLLPIGDPPLFLGYLRGVPFLWTLNLLPYWLGINGTLLVLYYAWDSYYYRKESPHNLVRDESRVQPLALSGKINLLLLLGIVLCVAVVIPHQPLLGTGWSPPDYFRECLMLGLVALSLAVTHPHTRVLNRFEYSAIIEVAVLFFGIFICMQVPIEILHARGPQLGVDSPAEFFWATGLLSSFLDNAPTYVVFYETAATLPPPDGAALVALTTGGQFVEHFLIPISLGAVLMGANTYIGNGPNFMVKSIAEQSGVKMPSFFGYMLYSVGILIPIFALLTWLTH